MASMVDFICDIFCSSNKNSQYYLIHDYDPELDSYISWMEQYTVDKITNTNKTKLAIDDLMKITIPIDKEIFITERLTSIAEINPSHKKHLTESLMKYSENI